FMAAAGAIAGAYAQDAMGSAGFAMPQFSLPSGSLDLPGVDAGVSHPSNYAPAQPGDQPLAMREGGEITLAAHLTEDSEDIPRGLVWRVFGPDAGPDGKLPLVAAAEGGTRVLHLAPGSYLVHAAFGRAGAT